MESSEKFNGAIRVKVECGNESHIHDDFYIIHKIPDNQNVQSQQKNSICVLRILDKTHEIAPSIRDSNTAQRLCKLYKDCTDARNGRGKKSKIITTCLWWTICSRVDNCKCCLACDSFCETGTRRGTKAAILLLLPAASIAIGSIEEIFVRSRPGQSGPRCTMRTVYVATSGFFLHSVASSVAVGCIQCRRGQCLYPRESLGDAKSILHFSILCAPDASDARHGLEKARAGLITFLHRLYNTSPSFFVLPKKRCLLPIELAMFANATLLRRTCFPGIRNLVRFNLTSNMYFATITLTNR
uniref:Uncharacterized protein n=1 Tax=Trichogramma kaykai TaxID=54128 RepID=A0ABD2WB14_9HYME